MQDLGQSDVIQVRPDTEVVGSFSLREISNLHKTSKPCNSEQNYSFTKCLRSYAETESQCALDVSFSNISRNRERCPTENLMKLFNILLWIKKVSWQDLTKTTGCISKCFIRKYQFELRSSENVKWSKHWISSFYLSAETTNRELAIESYSYDVQVQFKGKMFQNLTEMWQDLIGGIGGYLGLFLGWSCSSIITTIPAWLHYGYKLLQELFK